MLHAAVRFYDRIPVLVRLLVIIMLILTTFSYLLHVLEPQVFPTFFDAVWWAVVTSTTVGYGDFVPETVTGRIFAMILILFGIGFVLFFVTNLASSTVNEQHRWQKGTLPSSFSNHYIIVNWNERARQFIDQIQRAYPERQILLIDDGLVESPFHNSPRLQFLKGSPTMQSVLRQANVRKARALVITSGLEGTEQQADAQTILTLLTAKHYCDNIYTAAEILTSEQLPNARHAGADELIASNMISSLLMTESLEQQGIAETITLLLDVEAAPYLRSMPCPEDWIGRTFEEVSRLAASMDILPIGVSGEKKTNLHPDKESVLQEDQSLLVLESSR
ncbi:potassium channel family protein [Salibacterium qingdaonense]|uniref:Voltage-gated potassium channel n=1 Tax=Salibacterium qingdaonense TaxID=266892 RepID=A0A1I4QCS6_9BACI|nr:potassium channel family protein [Salibacterium qingdaonense]SFM37901.1 voltage-gated potassium channel [Salibacterium qingdaonense]